MLRFTTIAAAGLLAVTAAAHAAPELKRVRGTVESATDTAVTIKTDAGKTQEVQLTPETAFVDVVKSSLDNVKDGKFIGTATKGDNPPKAIELVIFPPEMNGTAEGHYAWDSINDPTGKGGPSKSAMTNGTVKSSSSMTNGTVKSSSSMTNGTVKSSSSMTNGTVKSGSSMTNGTVKSGSSMTNGTVKSGSSMTNGTVKSGGGSKMIDVTFDGGKSLNIEIPPKAPIVEFVKHDKSILVKGGKIFAVTAVDGDKLTGKLVAVGKDGVTPPM